MEIKKIDLDNIQLSSVNPRYTTISSIRTNLIDVLKKGNTSYDEKKVVIDLLSREGTFKDLKSLLSSIQYLGFDEDLEPIFVIDNGSGKVIVGEGNRRIMSLKLLTKKIKMPELKELMGQSEDEEELYSGNETDSEDRAKNYAFIVELIDKYKVTFDSNISVKVISDDKTLWKMIYTKHISGERPGMRRWPRGKYFVDILNFFPEGFLKNDEKKNNEFIITQIQRSLESVKSDFKAAQFVRDVFWSKFNFKPESLEEVYSMMKNNKVSSLQPNFSIKRIRDVVVKNLHKPKDYLSTKFSFIFNDELIIEYEKTDINRNEFLYFIYRFYKSGSITTRPIKDEKVSDFIKGVRNLIGGYSLQNISNIKDSRDINLFDYSIRDLKKINSQFGPRDRKFVKNIQNSFEISESFNNKIFPELLYEQEKSDPAYVFVSLKEQFSHNSKNGNYFINALGGTLRAMLEQIYMWSAYFQDTNEILEELTSVGQHDKQEEYIDKIVAGRIDTIFRNIRKTYKEERNNGVPLIQFMIQSISYITETRALEIAGVLHEADKNDLFNSILNESIHASHRIYKKENVEEFMENFLILQTVILEIFENIDFNKIKMLSDKIKAKI